MGQYLKKLREEVKRTKRRTKVGDFLEKYEMDLNSDYATLYDGTMFSREAYTTMYGESERLSESGDAIYVTMFLMDRFKGSNGFSIEDLIRMAVQWEYKDNSMERADGTKDLWFDELEDNVNLISERICPEDIPQDLTIIDQYAAYVLLVSDRILYEKNELVGNHYIVLMGVRLSFGMATIYDPMFGIEVEEYEFDSIIQATIKAWKITD